MAVSTSTRSVVLLLVTSVAIGCYPKYTIKPDSKTEEEFAADQVECEAQASVAGSLGNFVAWEEHVRILRTCMKKRGYTEDGL